MTIMVEASPAGMATLETAETMVTKMEQTTIGVHDVRKRNSIKVFSLYALL